MTVYAIMGGYDSELGDIREGPPGLHEKFLAAMAESVHEVDVSVAPPGWTASPAKRRAAVADPKLGAEKLGVEFKKYDGWPDVRRKFIEANTTPIEYEFFSLDYYKQ